MDTPGRGEFGTTKSFRGILWGHEIFWEILWGHEIFWSVKTLEHILFPYYCTVLLLFLAHPFSLSKISISLQYRFSHLYWNLLLFGLSFEKKPILLSTLTLIRAKFHDFTISRFWDMASSWKKGDNFFSVFPIFEAFLAIFGIEMYETLNRTGWF